MSLNEVAVYESGEQEITKLLDVLRETGQRLEELTSGEVDTVIDPEGRTLLLRGAREQLQRNEQSRRAAVLKANLEEFRTLAEAMPQIVWITRPNGKTTYFNQQWMDYTGLTLEESLGDGWNKPFHLEDRQRAWDAWQHATATRGKYTLECRLRRADGVYRWWLIRGVPYLDPGGTILKWFGTCTDIQDLKMFEEALFEEKESAQVRLNSIGDAVLCTDISGNNNFLNSVAVTMTGWTAEEAAGRPIDDVIRIKDATGGEIASGPIKNAAEQGKTVQLGSNCVLTRRDGIEIPIEGCTAQINGRGGRSAGAVIVVRDVSVARAMSLQLVHLAEHDHLTELPNQKVLRDRIDKAITMAAQNQKSVVVFFLDLDGFKYINDSLGHLMGDKLLQSTARRLEETIRASDTLCRFGGDEFIVLLPEVHDPEEAATEAARLLDAVAAIHSIGQNELQVSACIGISVYPKDGLDADELIKNADAAMYQAKNKGSSNYQFFHSDMNLRIIERQFIEQNLRRAMERNELALHYQPKYDVKSRAIAGVEALLRWTHPVRGSISPAAFISIAEDCGLILPIGAWVLEEACRQARVWLDAGLPKINIAVNVSGIQFQSERFEEQVMAVLDRFRIEPQYLVLEVTESLLMKTPELTARLLQSLRRKGVRVAIDDFGTGYSSLSYLRRFPFDTLKIDQSFVRQMDTADGVKMVKTIIDLGRNLGMLLIAEGVESEREATILEGLGCDRAQGYYFSRPLAPAQLASLLETSASRE